MQRLNFLTKIVIAAVLAGVVFLGYMLSPVRLSGSAETVTFEVQPGDGSKAISENLFARGLIRSPLAFELYVFGTGHAEAFLPGLYNLNDRMSAPNIVSTLTTSGDGEVSVTIPEGSNLFQIADALNAAGVASSSAFSAYALKGHLEGYLFPDTYRFFPAEPIPAIAQTFLDGFSNNAGPLLARSNSASGTLVLASILEKEVKTPQDGSIVAGILLKRIAAGTPLDVDASVCYGKQLANPSSAVDCAALLRIDFSIDSPYNTYLHKGLPPGPIGNPGVAMITAAENPQNSPYWYYLTDPATGNTVYAATLQQQEANIKKYLN